MSNFRVTSSGQYRVTSSGELRVVDGLGAMLGSVALSVALASSTVVAGVSGSTTLTHTTLGAVRGTGTMAGTATLNLAPNAALVADGYIQGNTGLTLAPVGSLQGTTAATATTNFTWATDATLGGVGRSTATTTLTWAATATPSATWAASGTSGVAFGVPNADLAFTVAFGGTAQMLFQLDGPVLRGRTSIEGGTDWVTALEPAELTLLRFGEGSSEWVSVVADAELVGNSALEGGTFTAVDLGATLEATGTLSGDTAHSFELIGEVHSPAYAEGSADLLTTLNGAMVGTGSLEAVTDWSLAPNAWLTADGRLVGTADLAFTLPDIVLTGRTNLVGPASLAFGFAPVQYEAWAMVEGSAPALTLSMVPASGLQGAAGTGSTELVLAADGVLSGIAVLSPEVLALVHTSTASLGGYWSMNIRPMGLTFATTGGRLFGARALSGVVTGFQFGANSSSAITTRPKKLYELWVEMYRTKQAILDALHEKSRVDIAANATATQGLTTRVTNTENQVSAQSQSITNLQSSIAAKTTTFVQNTQPTANQVGDLWIHTGQANALYTWDGANWILRNLDAGVRVFAQPSAPPGAGRREGDLWFDTDNNNQMHRWDGTGWAVITDGRIDAHATAISNLQTDVTTINGTLSSQSTQITNLQSTVAGKTSTFAQTTEPPATGRVVGDTWIDTDDGNKLYTWNGGWQLRNLDAGVSVFAQATTPSSVGRKVGDLWYDTDDNNRTYRWDGFNWAAIDDQRIASTASAVQSLTTRVDTQDGKFTNIEAKWNVTLDVNGYISGVESINNGSQSVFRVKASVFQIVDPGAPAITPFEVRGGTTYIKDAAIERLTVGKLTSGTLNADMQMGTGKIIYDNGVVMMVQGLGFGSTNQFLEWFGPRQTTGGVIDLSKCTESNAKSYKKTNGDEYMGGTLSVGVLKNGAQSTQISTNATVETGQFGSNGGARVVSYSLNYYNIGNSNTNAGAGPTSVVVTLQRSVNGGAWTTLSSFTASGAKTAEWDAELGYYAVEVTCGGSATYTDNSGGTGPINYRLVMSSPSGAWPWTNQGGSPGTQSLSVQSVEG